MYFFLFSVWRLDHFHIFVSCDWMPFFLVECVREHESHVCDIHIVKYSHRKQDFRKLWIKICQNAPRIIVTHASTVCIFVFISSACSSCVYTRILPTLVEKSVFNRTAGLINSTCHRTSIQPLFQLC